MPAKRTFLADHRLLLVIGIVGVTERAIGPKLKLKKLVAKLSAVPHAKVNR